MSESIDHQDRQRMAVPFVFHLAAWLVVLTISLYAANSLRHYMDAQADITQQQFYNGQGKTVHAVDSGDHPTVWEYAELHAFAMGDDVLLTLNPSRQMPESMPTSMKEGKGYVEVFNALGKDGWELVGKYDIQIDRDAPPETYWYFKRPSRAVK